MKNINRKKDLEKIFIDFVKSRHGHYAMVDGNNKLHVNAFLLTQLEAYIDKIEKKAVAVGFDRGYGLAKLESKIFKS